jgi:hypothetical protein
MPCASYLDGDSDAAGRAKRKQLFHPDKGPAGSGDLSTEDEERLGRSFSAKADESKIRGDCARSAKMKANWRLPIGLARSLWLVSVCSGHADFQMCELKAHIVPPQRCCSGLSVLTYSGLDGTS